MPPCSLEMMSMLKMLWVSSRGDTVRSHGIYFASILILAKFCLLTLNLSLNKNPKVIQKPSRLNMMGRFIRKAGWDHFSVKNNIWPRGMDFSHVPHNWQKRQFQKRATFLLVTAVWSSCAAPQSTIFKRQCSSGRVRSGGIIKNLPNYLKVKPTFRIERGETGRKGQNQQPLGFMEPCSSANTGRIQFAMSKTDPFQAGSRMARPGSRGVSVQKHHDFLHFLGTSAAKWDN